MRLTGRKSYDMFSCFDTPPACDGRSIACCIYGRSWTCNAIRN